jgi:hypothetical protein
MRPPNRTNAARLRDAGTGLSRACDENPGGRPRGGGRVAAGCMAKQNGSPTVGSDPTGTSTSTQGETYGAPRVGSPLDAARFLSQPCAVLTQRSWRALESVERVNRTRTVRSARASGPGCLWHARPEVDSTIGMSFLTGNKNGAGGYLSGSESVQVLLRKPRWRVIRRCSTIRVTVGPHGDCNITVGDIGHACVFGLVRRAGWWGQAVCDRAKQVAAAVIATLKAGS